MTVIDQHLNVLRIVEKLGNATCNDIFAYAGKNPGYDLPSDIGPLSNIVTRMVTHHSLLRRSINNNKVIFMLAEKGKKALAESVDIVLAAEPIKKRSKEIDRQQTRDYLRVVSAFSDDGGATVEDVLKYVKANDGFNIPHDANKICSKLSDLKRKRKLLVDTAKKNSRNAVILSPLGQDFLTGIDSTKTENKDDVMTKQIEAVPTAQTAEFHLEGLRKLLTSAVKVANKARMIAALDEIISSPALSLDVRTEVERTKAVIEQLEEA